MTDPAFPLALTGVPAAGREDWEREAAAVLRKAGRLAEDAPAEEAWARLTRRTLDGIEIAPLGTVESISGVEPGLRPPARGDGWDVRTHFADPDPAETAAQAGADLENGATSLWLQVGPTGLAHRDLAQALAGVLLDVAPVVLESDSDTLGAAQALVAILDERGIHPAPGTNLGADPLGAALRTGSPDGAVWPRHAGERGQSETDYPSAGPQEEFLAVARMARDRGVFAGAVDGTAVHDLGGSDAQELGWVIAVGVAYLRLLEDAGMAVAEAADLLEFRLAATDEQFPTIAKFRAARRLWARVLELSGVAGEDAPAMRLHAATSRPMMSGYDPYVNMLRTCVAAFAAGVGGADAVTVLPFDAPLGLPDGFSRRIARNTSALLIDEAHVAKVADPAGGAYAIERLTADLAEAAWAEFDSLERSGGAAAGIPALRERIGAIAAERDRQVARRQRPITGLTEFPNLQESRPERRPYAEGALQVRPWGHAFEALRAEPATVPVVLATMGPVAAHTARATFAANLLAAGGIETIALGATAGVDEVLAGYRQHGGRVVCLCGTDQAYAEWGAALVSALREAGAEHVIVAGKADLGQQDSCAIGVDALAFLTRTREALS